MTAEVSVMNRLGVALAADSALTVGSDAEKIYTSSDKLFQLSNAAPVGIMIYGNASFVGIPWEAVIKAFRSDLGNKRFNKLQDYGDYFFRFLRRNRAMFPQAAQDDALMGLIESFFLDLRRQIEEFLSQEAEKREGLDENQIAPIVGEIVGAVKATIRSQDRIKALPSSLRRRLQFRLRRRIAGQIKKLFGNLPMTAYTKRNLRTVALDLLFHHYFSTNQTGVVIAGFGEKEFMPLLYQFRIEEMVQNRPRAVLRSVTKISLRNKSSVNAFAQNEMVRVFMDGIDADLKDFMISSTSELFNGAIEVILAAITRTNRGMGRRLTKTVKPEIKKMLKELVSKWNDRSVFYWGPILGIVASLPKNELASMAEALVSLTSFRRRVTPERETVSEPIDVAILTKGDGFVWVKRKHYFEASLNPRTMARYTKEG